MKTIDRTVASKWTIGAAIVACGIGLMLLGRAVAGPVVQSTGETANQGTTSEQWPELLGYPWTSPQASEKTTSAAPAKRAAPAPSSSTSSSTGGQQVPRQQPTAPQVMPVPPTYAPGSPGAPSQSGSANPYGAMPQPPTGYGLYDAPNSQADGTGLGMVRPGVGSPMGGGAGGSMGLGQQPTGGLGGYGGYGTPPSPTPTTSLGGLALADPSFGRYESANIRKSTAPRQPAAVGQSQSQFLRGEKPFSGYRPQSAYSPYMRLSRDLTSANPGTNTYYEYVKPLLDQQQENRQVGHSLQGLSDTTRTGYQSLESLKQRPGNTIQNAAPRTPATFMNTGRYYPGFGR